MHQHENYHNTRKKKTDEYSTQIIIMQYPVHAIGEANGRHMYKREAEEAKKEHLSSYLHWKSTLFPFLLQ